MADGRRWTDADVDAMAAAIAAGSTVREQARIHGVHKSRIQATFKRFKGCGPQEYVGSLVNDSFGPPGAKKEPLSSTPSLSQLQDWIQQAADETATEPADVTRTIVCAHTPARPDHFVAYGGFPAVRADAFGNAADRQPNLGDRQGLRRNRNRLALLERELGDREYLARHLQHAVERAFAAHPIQLSEPARKPRGSGDCSRTLIAALSDLHFGLDVDPREVPAGGYNWTIASRRMGKVCEQIADWKPHRRDQTRLVVPAIGDIIHGVIHADDSGQKRLTEQIHGAAQILIPAFDFLCQHFDQIDVPVVPGNHERVTKLRQLAQRWDNYGHAVWLALVAAFRRQTDRIRFHIPRTGDATFALPGGDLAFVNHSDCMPTTGNPGGSVNTGKLAAEFNALNASGQHDKRIRLWIAGHYHTPFTLNVGTGSIVVNGALIGPDSYARNAVNEQSPGCPGQYLIESTADYSVGDTRLITLRDADDRAAYNEIVPVPSLELDRVTA